MINSLTGSNASLRRKLFIASIVPATAAMIVFAGVIDFYLRGQLRGAMVESLNSEAVMIGDNSSAAIVFDDPEDATRLLGAFRARPAVLAAAIYDESGRLFAAYTNPSRGTPPLIPETRPDSGTVLADGEIFVTVPIAPEGSAVWIASDLLELTLLLRRVAAVEAGILVLVLAAVLVASARLRASLLAPIEKLSRAARSVTMNRDYRVRIESPGSDKVGELGTAFNDMLDEIERHARLLGERETYFRSLIDNTIDLVVVGTADGRIQYESPSVARIMGYSEEREGRSMFERVHPDDEERARTVLEESFANPGVPWSVVLRIEHADGSWRVIDTVGTVLEDGVPEPLMIVNGRDITDRREAAEERRRLEQQLRQSQKMEAVGHLTGGVAHDFNNLLTVILGNLEMVKERLEQGDPGLNWLAGAEEAARSGAALTHQLLAFSRKQPLEPKVVDLGSLVTNTNDLLRRTLGETIEVETIGAGGLWQCEVDPSQLQNSILNLAINARDAMPDGGKLTIETGNARFDMDYAANFPDVEPGQYVMVSVSDTGTGIEPEVLRNVFDPFFTTKDVGRGSGLGLSMVYGFVKQSGGHVRIYSEPGHGTTVKAYFPRVVVERTTPEARPAAVQPRGAGETVLVVEDEASVRRLTVLMLEKLGYHPLQAPDAREALEVLESDDGIELLFTDVVLPGGVSGADLAKEAAARKPGLKILFTSGYTEDAILHGGRLEPGVELVQKPFNKATLAAKIRMVLDRDEPVMPRGWADGEAEGS